MRAFSTVIILMTLMAALSFVSPSDAEEDDLASWTFMVYLAADNNLESAGIEDVNEMERVGSTSEVDIIVQMDRWETEDSSDDTTNGDWTGCRRFRVEKDTDTQIMGSPMLEDLGEVNMGDPQVLIDFVIWSMDNFPARNYALVLWDHGGGWRGICWDETVPDSDAHDHLDLVEIGYALEQIYMARGSQRIELIGFDACLMAGIEVLYEIKDYGSVSVASGFNEPGDGWPYYEVLGPLVDKPSMDEREFGSLIVDMYVRSYTDREDDPSDAVRISMTAFDLRKMNPLVLTMDKFSEELASPGPAGSLRYLTQIYLARKNSNSYDTVPVLIYDLTGYPLYDIYDFTYELERLVQDAFPRNSRILGLCKEVRAAIDDLIIVGKVAPYYQDEVWGLSMYFPNKEEKLLQVRQLPTEYNVAYEEISYSRHHLWNEFLHAFYGIDPITDSLPVITISGPDFNHTFEHFETSGRIWGEAYDREGIRKVEVRIDDGEWMELPGITGQGLIGWVYNIDLASLEWGTHTIEVRAHDTLGETAPGHVTEPKRLVFSKEEAPPQGRGFEFPFWVLNVLLMIFVALGSLFGLILLKGRDRT
ncbi:MAG: clostripain-related cysteine peptidase [Candidatus Thermoplasmatota archaeon]|nr:clostripain-related cysteine peptidase [Candidatus Thermoplasmatota archaeon]